MHNKNKSLCRSPKLFMAMLPALLFGLNNKAQARDFFDPSFINASNGGDVTNIPDLSVYQGTNTQAPGDYRVDIVFNGRYLETKNVRFVTNDSNIAAENTNTVKLTLM